jgi:hypothetical protein
MSAEKTPIDRTTRQEMNALCDEVLSDFEAAIIAKAVPEYRNVLSDFMMWAETKAIPAMEGGDQGGRDLVDRACAVVAKLNAL